MARCLKCNYGLVLLEKKGRYKCAKCGSLFLEKEINEIEFQKFNQRERKRDIEEFSKIKRPKKPRKKMSEEERKRKSREECKRYYKKNREEILAKRRKYWAKKKEDKNQKRKEKRHANIDDTRQQGRLQHWKKRQKLLAEDNAEFVEKSLSNT